MEAMRSLEKILLQQDFLFQDTVLEQRYPNPQNPEKLNKNRINGRKDEKIDRLLEIEKLFYMVPDGKYLVKAEDEEYILTKRHDRSGKEPYGRKTPVVEIEPLKDSVPLKRDHIPYGIRGFCFPALGASYVHIDDVDTYRVNYHENLHMKIYRTDPNHPEWEIRMLEDWRLGEEKRH